MIRTMLCASSLALSVGGAAFAQAASGPAAAPPPAAPPAASPSGGASTSAAQGLTPGMQVKDATGAMVGTISRIGKTADGTDAAELNVNGKTVGIALSQLSPSPDGGYAVISVSKAQLDAATAKPPG